MVVKSLIDPRHQSVCQSYKRNRCLNSNTASERLIDLALSVGTAQHYPSPLSRSVQRFDSKRSGLKELSAKLGFQGWRLRGKPYGHLPSPKPPGMGYKTLQMRAVAHYLYS